MQIPILFESKDYLVLNKPAGLVVHADGRTAEPTLTDWILEKYPELKSVGEPLLLSNGKTILRPGIVHRIDRETSGVIVVAKNDHAFGFLKKQFKKREVRKIYHVFVYGEMKQSDGWIDRPIGRSKNDFRRYTAERGVRGEIREALTYYRVLEKRNGITFAEIQPKTGRTHQIRVHLKAIGYPVVADTLYAPKKDPVLGFTRTALHARSIEFRDLENKVVKVEAPYPEDFERGIQEFKA